jgi:AraC-like DNA-binding protein
LSIPPTLYIYIKNLCNDFLLTKKHNNIFIHYLPALILLLINGFSFIYFYTSKTNHIAYKTVEDIMFYANVLAEYFVFLIQVILYIYLSIKEYKNYKHIIKDYYSFEKGINLRWLYFFIIGFVFFIIGIYLSVIIPHSSNYFFSTLILLYVLFICFYSVFQELMYKKLVTTIKDYKDNITNEDNITEHIDELLTNSVSNEIEANPVFFEKVPIGNIDMQPSILSNNAICEDNIDEENINAPLNNNELMSDQEDAIILELSKNIETTIIMNEYYLDPEFSLIKLASYLSTNTKYISHAINSVYKKNFSTYINEFRIQKSIELLHAESAKVYTLESIALQSGFKSRSVFITHFKNITGKTPSQYKNEIDNNNI